MSAVEHKLVLYIVLIVYVMSRLFPKRISIVYFFCFEIIIIIKNKSNGVFFKYANHQIPALFIL